MLNISTILGRLTKDPELRYTQNNVPVCSFTVAVDRDFKSGEERQTDFIDCVAWRSTGEFVNKYFRKGNLICVSGRLQSRKWTDNKGNNRINWEIIADGVYFGGSKNDSSTPAAATAPTEEPASPFHDIPDDDVELPF